MAKAHLVGILNLTPDSFSDGGQYSTTSRAVDRYISLIDDGAAFVDIGAESTRPGATPLDANEEWSRLEPVITKLTFLRKDDISIDTHHPETVEKVSRLGNYIINDVTGFADPRMIEAVAGHQLTCIVSHLPTSAKGQTQAAHSGKLLDSADQVKDELLAKREELVAAGITLDKIILDPGIGFGKTRELNYELLGFAELVDPDVMVGYSRKKFLGKHRFELAPNLEAAQIAIAAGSKYLRVHDVAAHKHALSPNRE